MTVIINEDFETDTSANWDGAARTVDAGGNGFLIQTVGGLTIHQTQVTTGTQFWMRFGLNGAPWESNGGPSISNATGDGILWILDQQSTNLVLEYVDQYDSYETYDGGTFENPNDVIAGHTLGDEIGCVVDLTANTMSFWVNVTAAEPTNATNWDGGSNPADLVHAYGTAGHTQEGTYAGFGNWNTASGAGNYTFFAAGTIGAAPAGSIITPIQGSNLGSDLFDGTIT